MSADWKPAAETPPADEPKPVEGAPADAPVVSEGMKSFIAETKELFDKLPAEAKPPEGAAPAKPVIAEPAVKPKEDSGFIKDLATATPEDYQKRISYLYAKTKENERLWAEARDFQKKQTETLEQLRAEQKKRDLALSEKELDELQLRVIDLLDRNSPNYNAAEGAKLLRELTTRDAALKQERADEVKRAETVKADIERSGRDAQLAESKRIIDDWATTRSYAQPGHPLFAHVQNWLKQAYEKAPEHVTVQDIVNRAQELFDRAEEKRLAMPAAKPNGGAAARAPAPGTGMTVSQVLGTSNSRTGPPANPGEKLTQQQRTVAERLFYDPEKGITKAKAYEMYAEGLNT